MMMRLMRKSKLIFLGFTIFFFGYCTINYVALRKARAIVDEAEHEKTKQIAKYTEIVKVKSEPNSIKTEMKRYYAYDGGGFGSINRGVVTCLRDNNEVEIVNSDLAKVDIVYFGVSVPNSVEEIRKGDRPQYSMVYALESEPHSAGGDSWHKADFRMYYNLDHSFPEPATYFDVKMHLADLLTPPKVSFPNKNKEAPVTWVVSNCNAYNGRQNLMKELMKKVTVDSYGQCLKNKYSHPSEHMKGNIELFTKYKFVIAIENSNCEDYVTEKLVHAVASGSIPIVAGKDNKPDYDKFLPKNSYINVYDYKTVDDLAKKLNQIASDRTEYEKYIKFKLNHKYTRKDLYAMSLDELIRTAKTIMDPGEKFFSELIKKETSDNKLCKLAKYLRHTPKEEVSKQIELNRSDRPDASVVCLNRQSFKRDFNL